MLASEREGDDGGYVNDRWWVHLATRKKITAENQKSPGKLKLELREFENGYEQIIVETHDSIGLSEVPFLGHICAETFLKYRDSTLRIKSHT